MIKKSLVLFLLAFCFGVKSYANDLRDADYDTTRQGAAAAASATDIAEGNPANVLKSEVPMGEALSLVVHCKATIPTVAKIQAAYATYLSTKESCVNMQAKAATACLESLSPEMADTTAKVNMLLSTIGSAAVSDACSGLANAMQIAKAGMSAYTAACGALRAGCSSSCIKAKTALEEISKLAAIPPLAAIAAGPEAESCKAPYQNATKGILAAVQAEMNTKDVKSIAGKGAVCTGKYVNLLASGALGLVSVIQSMNQAKACKKATDGSTTVADLSNLDVKCAMAEYKNTSECICHLNPRQTGCVNSLDKAGSSNQYSGMNAGSGSSNIAPVGGSVSLPTGNDATMPDLSGKGASSAGMPGAPTGGGSGLGGGSAGGNSGSPGGEGEHKGLNTNILAGSGGGGGGGFGGGFGGGSAADSKYRPYLPGGAKDPSRGVAGQAISNEVTGQAGKSNWEKVRDRYRDNNSSLLGN